MLILHPLLNFIIKFPLENHYILSTRNLYQSSDTNHVLEELGAGSEIFGGGLPEGWGESPRPRILG